MLCNLLFVLFERLQVAQGFVRRLARASSSSSQACKVLSGPKTAFLTNLADLFCRCSSTRPRMLRMIIRPPADAHLSVHADAHAPAADGPLMLMHPPGDHLPTGRCSCAQPLMLFSECARPALLRLQPPASANAHRAMPMLVRAPHPRARSRNLCSRKTVTFVTFPARDESL